MQRMPLDPEEQKVVIRWRLGVVGFYTTIAIITLLVATLTAHKDAGVRQAQTTASLPAHAKH